MSNAVITVSAIINAPIDKIWNAFTDPKHIVHWNFASDDWHSPAAKSNFTIGGEFVYRMEAKDGSFGFDFIGTFTDIVPYQLVAYTIADGRKVFIHFRISSDHVIIEEVFEAEKVHPLEMQQVGWQAIINNFKKYVEAI